MKKLLQIGDKYRWNLDGIEFVIKERIGQPQDFIGRVEELEFLYAWAGRIQHGASRSIAFLGRRKVGKSLILERLYNILYSEHKGLIPFYYEFTEGKRSGKEFYHDFATRFYMQLLGYYNRDITWIEEGISRDKKLVDINILKREFDNSAIPYKKQIKRKINNSLEILEADDFPLYEYVIPAVAVPHGFASAHGVADRVVQMIDEFQYFNMYIDAGVEDKPCKAYMATAESRHAPLLITGSLMGVVAEELMRWLPQRFGEMYVPKMKSEESIAMTLNYGSIYGHTITPEIADYIYYITNGIPGRIIELLSPKINKAMIHSIGDVDKALEFEVSIKGTIKDDWDDYLKMAMNEVNNVNMRQMTYFLCRNEGTRYSPTELKKAMALKIEDSQLRQDLELLFKYDIIELDGGRYGGVFDRTLKKVLMKNYSDILNLSDEEFVSYFKNDNMLDYLKERVELLEIGLAEAENLRNKLAVLRGEHNDLKGHYYKREVLLAMIQGIIDNKGGLVRDISVTAFTSTLNYHLETGEEIDIVLEGEQVVIMAECKNYLPRYLHNISKKIVDEFMDKARRLHQSRFTNKEFRLGFFSRHGFETKMADYINQCGLVCKVHE